MHHRFVGLLLMLLYGVGGFLAVIFIHSDGGLLIALLLLGLMGLVTLWVAMREEDRAAARELERMTRLYEQRVDALVETWRTQRETPADEQSHGLP